MKKLLLGLYTLVWATNAFALVPPWVYQYHVLRNTIGQSDCFKVELPPSVSKVDVRACSVEAGQALLLLANNLHYLRVTDAEGREIKALEEAAVPHTPEFVQEQLGLLLKDNPIFVRLHRMRSTIIIETKPRIAQFYTDNIGDPYRHATFLAQDLILKALKSNLFDKKVYLGSTTSRL